MMHPKKPVIVACTLVSLILFSHASAQTDDGMTGAEGSSPDTFLDVSEKGPAEALSLKEFTHLIGSSDEMVLAQRIEGEVALEGIRGAKAIFEPSFFLGIDREHASVLNTASETLQRAGQAEYKSDLLQYKTGLNFKALTGADAEISYNLSRIENSLQDKVAGLDPPEYRAYLGAKLTQPLLKSAGVDVTTIPIQLAEHEKDVARETLRHVLTQRVIDGINVYLNLQRAGERVRLRAEARETAERILRETREQEKAGLKTGLDALDAETALALRNTQLAQAQQDYEEQINSFQMFVSARERAEGSQLESRRYSAADPLMLLAEPLSEKKDAPQPSSHIDESLTRRPEMRVNQIRRELEETRVRYARNQRMPELNVSARYGLEDLTANQHRAFQDYFGDEDIPYNSWNLGMQFKVHLFGDQKAASDYNTALLRLKQIDLARTALRQRIADEVQSSAAVLEKGLQQVRRQQEMVNALRELVAVEGLLVEEGRKSSIDVMKRKLDTLAAEETLADSIAIANRAYFVASQAQGLLLSRMELE